MIQYMVEKKGREGESGTGDLVGLVEGVHLLFLFDFVPIWPCRILFSALVFK